jgi:hypothetical protein
MGNWFADRLMISRESPRSMASGHIKRCPLCGALNSLRNQECFVCRWHGSFDHDRGSIDAGLSDLLDRCPELADAMFEPTAPRRPFKRSVFHWLAALFRPRVDYRA